VITLGYYRVIKSKIDHDKLIVSVAGYDISYKIKPTTTVDAVTKYADGFPDFTTTIELEYIKIIKQKTAKSLKQIEQKLNRSDLIPIDLIYNYVDVGFVYNEGDPNNHRWMINFFNNKDMNIYNLYCDNLIVKCPFHTRSWKDGIWHGRFTIYRNDLQAIKEPKAGHFVITGKIKPLTVLKDPQPIPPKTQYLRLRFNINANIWYCDFLTKTWKEIQVTVCNKVICTASWEGIKTKDERPKVSAIINVKDISGISQTLNSFNIRGL